VKLKHALVVGVLGVSAAARLAHGQILPPNASEPVEVQKAKGEFAQRLHGAVFPKGKGWKPVMDRSQRVQILVPDKWKVEVAKEGDTVITAYPPGKEKIPKGMLAVMLRTPKDDDPLLVDEPFAASFAEALAEEPDLKKLQFKPTDSGYVLAHGLRFALAGGSMVYEEVDLSKVNPKAPRPRRISDPSLPRIRQAFQQQQLVYISEDRIVTIQFTAQAADFPQFADDVAKIFASYTNLGVRRI
jgi:hypothetical protein